MPQPVQETRFQELKRYVRFDARDAELLGAFGERAAPEFPRIAQEFYDRIREHSEAHDVFTGEEQIQRLQRSLVLWLGRVCGGEYDEAYHEQTAQMAKKGEACGGLTGNMKRASNVSKQGGQMGAGRLGRRHVKDSFGGGE